MSTTRSPSLVWIHQVGKPGQNSRISSSHRCQARGAPSPTSSTATTATEKSAFDFETSIDRSDTGALKWDKYEGKDVVPLWVADMDLRTAPVIEAAVHKRVEHGIFGYTSPTNGVQEAVMKYYEASACVGMRCVCV